MNFDNADLLVENYSYNIGIAMLVSSFVLGLLSAYYLDAVLPKAYGDHKPPCFCFAFCCKKKKFDSEEDKMAENNWHNTIRDLSEPNAKVARSRR